MMKPMELIQDMFVFMIIMVRLGRKLEQILMEKQWVITVVFPFLYRLTDQG